MIDLNKLEDYIENNRIEAKKALGGLPHSIWETYSAFANTLGGVILLGVEEYKDKSFHAVDLPDPKRMKQEFWDAVNNPKIASVNILSSGDVRIEEVNGKHILVINVPRAERFYKPVYVEGNPLNTYRRSGEGDHKVSREEYQAMVRDASARSQDMLVLNEMRTDVFDPVSVRNYRRRMKIIRPGHVWGTLDNETFLLKIGAAAAGEDGKMHPTAAGLLMFGNEYDIVREFSHYFLDYREEMSGNIRRKDRITSSSGDWSGNVLEFYFRVNKKLHHGLKTTAAVRNAVREALTNSIVNADYYGQRGIVVIKNNDMIRIENPGSFRIRVDTAKGGGVSDPRNSALLKMFSLIDIGKRAGSGIPGIFRIWKEQHWQEPEILQFYEPDRTVFILPFLPAEDQGSMDLAADDRDASAGLVENAGESSENGGSSTIFGNKDINLPNKIVGKNESAEKLIKRQMIIDYLTEHIEASAGELAEWTGLKPPRVRDHLRELIRDEIVIAQGAARSRVYRLKS